MDVNCSRFCVLCSVLLSLILPYIRTIVTTNSKCIDGWVTQANLPFCYKYMSTDMVYPKALRICEDEGGQLVMPKTRDENEFVKSLIHGKGQQAQISTDNTTSDVLIWIGLNDKETENEWMWIDGTILNETTFSDWGSDGQSYDIYRNCVVFSSFSVADVYRWYDVSCASFFAAICQKEKGVVGLYNTTDRQTTLLSKPHETPLSSIQPIETDRTLSSGIQKSETYSIPSSDVQPSETDKTTLPGIQPSETTQTPSLGGMLVTDNSTRPHTSACECACITVMQNATNFTFSHLIEDKMMLSSYRRKLISADDPRTSARASGYCGIVIICALPVILVVMDCSSIKRHCKRNCSEGKNSVHEMPL